jgi:WD40 repeat protein/tRNA A-37 threonylcarbamoyl transferase component Bud32
MPKSNNADQNLLFGVLALQMDFISRDKLVAAMNSWVLEKSKSLGEILVNRGSLTTDRYMLLQALVQEHLKQHDGDAEKSLAAVSSLGSVGEDLKRLGDAEIEASLAHVPAANTAIDRHATLASSAGSPTSPGQRFRILRPHAKGGLGQVSVARDEELHREVALKELQDRHADNLDSRSRFMVEAEITGSLEHPGIVPVYGLGTYADGRPFYAMRFVQGDSLKDAIERFHKSDEGQGFSRTDRALEFRKLLGRLVDVCNAIDYAHSRGVLHRDLKPGNIMLGQYGETLVVDWGLAKPVQQKEQSGGLDQRAVQPASLSGSAATMMGSAVGTPQYMSPEQAAGDLDRLGPASDVYSLGATLYCLLAGVAPIHDADLGVILQRVQRGDFTPPRQVKKGIPAALEAICLKAMARKAEDRYNSPRALGDDIEHWLADEPVSVYRETVGERLARWTRRHRAWAQAAAVALLAVVGVSLVAVVLINAQRKVANQQRQLAEGLAREKEVMAETERSLRKAAERQTAVLMYEQALATSVQEDATLGLLSFGRCLERTIEIGASDLEDAARKQLSRWSGSIHSLSGIYSHAKPILAVAFAPDGESIVTGSADKTAQIWETSSGKPRGAPLRHEDVVTAVAFSADGTMIATASRDKTVRLWQAATAQPLGQVLEHADAVTTVAFSPDGKKLVTGGDDARALLWDVKSRTTLRSPLEHKAGVTSASFSPDGKTILTGSWDGTIQVWDVETTSAIGSPLENPAPVMAAKFGPDGKMVAVGGLDNKARLWNIETRTQIGLPLEHQGIVTAVAIAPDGKSVLTASLDGTAQLWHVSTSKRFGPPLRHSTLVGAAAFNHDGTAVLTGCGDMSARRWSVATGKSVTLPLSTNGNVAAVGFADAKTALTAAAAIRVSDSFVVPGEVRRWRADTGKPVDAGANNAAWLDAIAFSPDGHTLVAGTEENSAQIWDLMSGRPIGSPLKHDAAIKKVIFSPDGKLIATASQDKTVRLWQANTGSPLGAALEHDDVASALAFSPDNKILASGCLDMHARLWEVSSGKMIGSPIKHPSIVTAVAFEPRGELLFTGAYDGVLRMWNVQTAKPAGPTLKHNARINAVTFSPDGTMILTASEDATGVIWDTLTRRQIGPRLPHDKAVSAAAFSPDGQNALTGSLDWTARLWRISPVEGQLEQILLWIQVITGTELDENGALRVLSADDWRQRREQLDKQGVMSSAYVGK